MKLVANNSGIVVMPTFYAPNVGEKVVNPLSIKERVLHTESWSEIDIKK